MKKALALVLAIVLVLGMSTVAFAKSRTDDITIDESVLYRYDASSKKMMVVGDTITPGDTYYYLLENTDKTYPSTASKTDPRIKSTSALENYRLSYSVSDGKKLVSSVNMVVKDVNSFSGDKSSSTDRPKGKYAFIAVALKEDYSSESTDVNIEIKPTAKGSEAYLNSYSEKEEKNLSFEFSYTVGYDSVNAGSYTTIDDSTPVVNFDDIEDSEEIELYFGEDLQFNINAKGQKELFLKYSDDPTDTKMDLSEKYPDANIDYHIFLGTNKTFRRTGTLIIQASSIGENKAPYVYEIDTAGKLTQVKPKYDNEEEEFTVSTTTLKNYVISDVALKATSSSSSDDEDNMDDEDIDEESSSSSSVPTPKPPTSITPDDNNDNPATGANDFVGLAVALTAASFVAIGIAGRKINK